MRSEFYPIHKHNVFESDPKQRLAGTRVGQTRLVNIHFPVPLLIYVPQKTESGSQCHRLVELVDIYPTLCEAAGIDVPANMEGANCRTGGERPFP